LSVITTFIFVFVQLLVWMFFFLIVIKDAIKNEYFRWKVSAPIHYNIFYGLLIFKYFKLRFVFENNKNIIENSVKLGRKLFKFNIKRILKIMNQVGKHTFLLYNSNYKNTNLLTWFVDKYKYIIETTPTIWVAELLYKKIGNNYIYIPGEIKTKSLNIVCEQINPFDLLCFYIYCCRYNINFLIKSFTKFITLEMNNIKNTLEHTYLGLDGSTIIYKYKKIIKNMIDSNYTIDKFEDIIEHSKKNTYGDI